MPETTPVKTTFRITTYWKRPRGQPGLTQLGSRRLTPSGALTWLLTSLPDGAVTEVTGPGARSVLTIDWERVDA